jgi:hypothetical protein
MFFDMAGRAKWDAWNEFGRSIESELDPIQVAEDHYLKHARNLGWSESYDVSATIPDTSSEAQKGGGGGMWVSVSVPVAPDTGGEDSVHGYAVSGNLERLRDYLDKQPEQLNSRDEFVSTAAFSGSITVTLNLGIHAIASRYRPRPSGGSPFLVR